MEPITGLVAPVHTPMHADGPLKLEVVPKIVDHIQKSGVIGVFVCGSTGEGPSMSVDERKQTAEAYAEANAGRLKLIVHVGHNALIEARALAAHAADIGANAIAMAPPNYFKPRDARSVAMCLKQVSDVAPDLPLYYYHIPAMSGVAINVADLLEVADELCPALAGVKFTFENLQDFIRCLRFADGRFNMLFGRDEMLLSALIAGGRGAVGSTYNYAAPIYTRLIDAFTRGDIETARIEQWRAAEFLSVFRRMDLGVNGHKAMMKLIGIDCGPCRLPVAALTADEDQQLESDLREMGFFEWIR